jgi:hypothetical protein
MFLKIKKDMKEIIIIETDNSNKVRSLLSKEKINYQVFYEKEQDKEDKLLQEYREAWQNPQRLAEANQ